MVCHCTPEQLRAATRTAVLDAVREALDAAARSADTFSLYQGQAVRPAAWYTTTVWQPGQPRVQCTGEVAAVSLSDTVIQVDILLTIQPI